MAYVADHMPRQRIAVVGSGISGLSAAWALSKVHDVTLFEADNRIGGHANTVDIDIGGVQTPVDTGFIVFNDWTYPQLIALFKHLAVDVDVSNMSFGISLDDGSLEYASDASAGSLFAQKRNALRPGYWRMLLDMKRFYAAGPKLGTLFDLDNISLGDLLREMQMSEYFIRNHIVPMAACIWSGSFAEMMAFPARTFVTFFQNHGLFLLQGRPQWRTVRGGSRHYVQKLLADFVGTVLLRQPVHAITRTADKVQVQSAGQSWKFDQVVLATHGDVAHTLVQNKSVSEAQIMGAFRTSENQAHLHRDARLMPQRRRVWSSWNYVGSSQADDRQAVPISYWMNRLQNLDARHDVFVSLNPRRDIDPHKIDASFTYRHPIFDRASIQAQSRVHEIQGKDRIWYCGAYLRYGFHEDGCMSGLAVARALGAPPPWERGIAAAATA
jgi:uncharacterized protein